MPLINEPGWYMTRTGQRVRVDYNYDGWLDGLPFKVFERNNFAHASYTVNEDGFLYPFDHPAYRDAESWEDRQASGYWQPDLFKTGPQPRLEMRQDLVQKCKES